MSKVIEITLCTFCPHFRQKWNAAPYCSHPEKSGKAIPYKQAAHNRKEPTEIPKWCPLEDSVDFAETHFDIDNQPA